jgi:cellulose synthase/poly-beta-1,6-N-acetylglucosamine synthase-like glycosyltransferase
VPAVDVIITSCNEDVEIIQDTMLAVLSMDYPEAKFRVILADDGASAELESWVAGLGRPNVHYTSRSLRVGFKAGNLNHAVKEASKLPGGPHELIAALDADMIPVKRWLRSTVAHIILDDRMGLVCPTQVIGRSHLTPCKHCMKLMESALIITLAILQCTIQRSFRPIQRSFLVWPGTAS